MAKIVVSGHINIETTVKVKEFPIPYFPIDYPFYGVHSFVSGVGVNVAKALMTLGNDVLLVSVIGEDEEGSRIVKELVNEGIDPSHVQYLLEETCQSVVLYDDKGRRQIYCDLKDIQNKRIKVKEVALDCDLAVICNINFNRELLKEAKKKGIKIATDVHVLSHVEDEYNKDFLTFADIIFLSDEMLPEKPEIFLSKLADLYEPEIIVLGQGEKGAMIYLPTSNECIKQEAIKVKCIVNTVGAGDALFSGFIHYYCKGVTPEEALLKAQIFASNKIQTNGAATGFISEEKVEEQFCNRDIG